MDLAFDTTLILALTALAGLCFVTVMAARAWNEWISLKRAELVADRGLAPDVVPHAGNRIEVADLKERVRRLEAIASGIDL